MRSPELGQQTVQLLPLPLNRFLKPVRHGGVIGLQGDLLKVLGFDGLERLGYPSYARPHAQKHQLFELPGLGEVKRSWRGLG